MSTAQPARKKRTKRKKSEPARVTLAKLETEAGFQGVVIDFAQYRGWLVNHNYDSRKSGPDNGLPDLIMARDGRLIFMELKKPGGVVSAEQQRWLDVLKKCPAVLAVVARPQDWASVKRVLM
jgi:hypothetical protein